MHNQLSVVIISKNEEKFIADAVKSASFADEVLVLDSGSTDATCMIAKNLGARVEHQDWLGFGLQKNKAVALAQHDWVFVLDSDERITLDLQTEILQTLKTPNAAGYYVARLNNFFGKNIRYCGLYPDYSVRLFNRNKGQFNNVTVHEKKKNLLKAFVSPIWTFIKIYLLRLGILEGWRGFVIAKVYAQYTFWKYIK